MYTTVSLNDRFYYTNFFHFKFFASNFSKLYKRLSGSFRLGNPYKLSSTQGERSIQLKWMMYVPMPSSSDKAPL